VALDMPSLRLAPEGAPPKTMGLNTSCNLIVITHNGTLAAQGSSIHHIESK
jgi:hypothetical protein